MNHKAEILQIIKDLDKRADELQKQENAKKLERFFINLYLTIALYFYWLITFGKLK